MRDLNLLDIAVEMILNKKAEILAMCGLTDFTVTILPTPNNFVTLKYLKDGTVCGLAEFGLDMLDGCCGVVVSHHVQVWPSFRGKGLGQLLLQIRQQAILAMGYTMMIATSIARNERENHILQKNGFKPMHQFVNNRTQNTVTMWQKNLREDAKPFTVDLKDVPVAVVQSLLWVEQQQRVDRYIDNPTGIY